VEESNEEKEYPETNLRKLRESHKLTREQFAHKTNMSSSNIAAIESGARALTLNNALRLCDLFDGTTLDYLYCRKEPEDFRAAHILSLLREYFGFVYDEEMNRITVNIKSAILDFFQELENIEHAIKKCPSIVGLREAMINKVVSDYDDKISKCSERKSFALYSIGEFEESVQEETDKRLKQKGTRKGGH